MNESAQADGAVDLSAMNVTEVVKMVGAATDEQLGEGMQSENRAVILAEVFRQMEEHFQPGAASDVDAFIHWKITGGPEDRTDHWEAVIKDGKCTCNQQPQGDPRVTLSMDGPTFLRLVTGNAAGPMLFMSGQLKIEGDVMFSARMVSMFTIPGAPAASSPQPGGAPPAA